MNVVLWLHWAGTGAKLVYVLRASCTRSWIFDACTILAWYNAIHQTRCISASPKRLLIYVSGLTFVSFSIALTVYDWGCGKTHWNTSLSRDWQYKNALYAAVISVFHLTVWRKMQPNVYTGLLHYIEVVWRCELPLNGQRNTNCGVKGFQKSQTMKQNVNFQIWLSLMF